MKKTNITKNPSRSMLANVFIITASPTEDYHLGDQREIFFKNKSMGVAEVVDVSPCRVNSIPQHVAYLISGNGAQLYQSQLLTHNRELQASSYIEIVTFRWMVRLPDANEAQWKEAWEYLKEDYFDQAENADVDGNIRGNAAPQFIA